MLPTDVNCDYMSKLNAIQNALQKAEVHLSHEQAAMVFSALNKDLTMAFILRRKKEESGKTIMRNSKT